ncbi:uncharacterized protein C9orf57 homolog [Lemur catta]|uniref:uncharacterized protein C9orf57 homolog n=1 Tax=Lemur catta TaxID=9447 RepID=UPI001E266C5E|nr:uncharacterized protein C9orf57 homolog [Lemur catta]
MELGVGHCYHRFYASIPSLHNSHRVLHYHIPPGRPTGFHPGPYSAVPSTPMLPVAPHLATLLVTETGNVICRSCKLSIAFHGCLLDFGTCRTKPGQYCKIEIYNKGGIEWYSTKGCTENTTECFQKIKRSHGIYSTHCCLGPLCNF